MLRLTSLMSDVAESVTVITCKYEVQSKILFSQGSEIVKLYSSKRSIVTMYH